MEWELLTGSSVCCMLHVDDDDDEDVVASSVAMTCTIEHAVIIIIRHKQIRMI